jgi:hypothetical protein
VEPASVEGEVAEWAHSLDRRTSVSVCTEQGVMDAALFDDLEPLPEDMSDCE